MKHLRWMCALVALSTLFSVCTFAQTLTGTLVGTVTDVTGASTPAAKITITEVNTNVSRTSQSNESGNYTFPNLPPGTYSVTAEKEGFKKEVRANVEVLVNTNPRVDISLTPGSISESVEVTAAAPPIQADTASVGVQLQSITIATTPLGNNRNFQSLLNLVPGTTPATFQHSQFFNAASSLQTEVNGQLRMGNNYMIEGTDNNERTGLLQILIPPIEAIQSVDVSLSNHDPEMGRAAGAVVNVILKSGTNDFHGAAFEFLQNSDFNSRSFFNPSVGHLAYNYVGGNLGGPIKKNKLFFFGDYLRVMDHEANTNLMTTPPNAWRTGNLSSASTTIYDPSSGNQLDGTGRTAFAGNIIPTNRINPVSAAILAGIPGTNQGSATATTNNYFALLPFTKTTDSFDIKIDDNISEKDRLTGRFSYARPVVFQAPAFGNFGGPANGAFAGTGTQKTYSAGLNYDHIFSPTLVSELRIAVSHYHNEATPTDYGKNDATSVGIPGVNINQFTSGMVGVQIDDGFSNPMVGYSASLPWIRAEANVDIVNTWTKSVGNHTFKWGFDLKRVRDDLLQDQNFSPRGLYQFGAKQTALATQTGTGSFTQSTTGIGNDFASFLLDVPYQAARDVNAYFPAYRQWNFFGYGGDKWQVSSKLTVDLGLRWEFYPPATPQFNGGFSNYDASNNTLVIAGVGSNPSNLGMKTRYNYFAPRIGIAYRANEKMVVRAGFGTSYTPFPDNTYAYNYPVRSNNQYVVVGNGYAGTLLPGNVPANFQNGFPLPVAPVIPSNGIIAANTPLLLAQSMITVNKNFKNPYVESWNFAIQRALPLGFTLDTAYVGSHGVGTVATYNLNTNTSALGLGSAGQPLNQLFGKTAGATLYFAGYSSSYHSLQAKLDRKVGSGLFMTTAFTWGKAMGYQQADDGGLLFYINPQRNYARADFDRQFVYSQSFNYELPFGHGHKFVTSGPLSNVVGGWRLSGTISLASGTPMTFQAPNNLNTPGSTQTADQIGEVSIPHGINVGNPWFSRQSFVAPGTLRFGSSGRNILSGPGLFALNASLSKSVRLTERFKAEVRLETFNLTNTPQFANPQTTVGNATYGYVTGTLGSGTGVNGTGGGRAVQLGARINF